MVWRLQQTWNNVGGGGSYIASAACIRVCLLENSVHGPWASWVLDYTVAYEINLIYISLRYFLSDSSNPPRPSKKFILSQLHRLETAHFRAFSDLNMTSLLELLTMSNVFLDTPVGLSPTLADPRHLCLNTPKAFQGDNISLMESSCEQKAKPESGPQSNQEFKPQLQSTCNTRRSSKRYSSRDEASPERIRHLERNRIAAMRCRTKRNKEHRQIQSVLDSEMSKRKGLLGEINVLKEMVWHLKNQLFEHATKCDDQKISQYLALEAQDVLGSSTAWLQYPSSFPGVPWPRSVEDRGRDGADSNRLEFVENMASESYPEGMFGGLLDVPQI